MAPLHLSFSQSSSATSSAHGGTQGGQGGWEQGAFTMQTTGIGSNSAVQPAPTRAEMSTLLYVGIALVALWLVKR